MGKRQVHLGNSCDGGKMTTATEEGRRGGDFFLSIFFPSRGQTEKETRECLRGPESERKKRDLIKIS